MSKLFSDVLFFLKRTGRVAAGSSVCVMDVKEEGEVQRQLPEQHWARTHTPWADTHAHTRTHLGNTHSLHILKLNLSDFIFPVL